MKSTVIISLLMILILLSGFVFVPVVQADTYQNSVPQWVRVVNDDTKLYTNASTTKITCTLHKSYYLKVITATSAYYQVEFMNNTQQFPKITGYVLQSQVEEQSETPELPYYPSQSIVVKENSAPIYLSPLSSAEVIVVATNTQTMSYYGYIDNLGTTWYYVYYSGVFGYVQSQYTTQPDIPLHPTPLPVTPEPDPTPTPNPEDDPTQETPPQSGTSEIVLIIFVILLSVGLVLALFLPGNLKKKSADSYYDKYM